MLSIIRIFKWKIISTFESSVVNLEKLASQFVHYVMAMLVFDEFLLSLERCKYLIC